MGKFFIAKIGVILLAPALMFSEVMYKGGKNEGEMIVSKAGLKPVTSNGKDTIVFTSKKKDASVVVYAKDTTLNKKLPPMIPLRVNVTHGSQNVTAMIEPQILTKNQNIYLLFQTKTEAILFDASKEVQGKSGGEVVDISF